MPYLPPKPCTNAYCPKYAVKNGKCEDHQPKSGWFKKGSRHKAGYDADWDRTRIIILDRDQYLCQRCLRMGIYTQARDVDHIIPKSRGGTDASSNLEAICEPCHKLKTRLERSFPRKAIRPMPDCIVKLVCGPPGSGKSTYVKENAEPFNIVICLDSIMEELSGLPRHKIDTKLYYRQALSERNRRIDALHESPKSVAFIIMSLPKVTMRREWQSLLDGEIIYLDVDRFECEKRIRMDSSRGTRGIERSLEALDYYFSVYSY